MQAYGIPFLYASCGVFWENTMSIVSKIVRKQLQSWSYYYWRPYWIVAWLFLLFKLVRNFLFLWSLLILSASLSYFLCTWVAPFCTLHEFVYLSKKIQWAYKGFDFAANNLEVDALFVYTKTGHMASLLSRCRPDCPIFAFTTSTSVRRRLNLQWGLIPFRLSFADDMESNLNKTFSLLKARNLIKSGDLVIAVSDMLQSIQVMNVPWKVKTGIRLDCKHCSF